MKKRSHKILVIIIFIISALVAFFGWKFYKKISAENSPEVAKEPEPEKIIPKPTEIKSRLLFTGTTFWGRRTNTASENSELGIKYPFEKLDTLERANYNAWIGNLECPITENDHTEYEEETLLVFNCRPEYLDEVEKYFTAFSLGTNHTDNWGEEGIESTKENLKAHKIQYFGHYRYDNSTENCGIVVIPVEITYDDNSTTKKNLPLGLCSAHGVFGIPTTDALENIAHFSETLPTIVMPHMGVEYESRADELRTNLFHTMIDLGAEMVLADHPHWIQNTEAYKGHLIAYSMGNFMFDQQAVETNRSSAIAVTANFSENLDLEAWEKLSEICLEKDGDCLEDIIEENLPRLDITWNNYDFVPTMNTNYQTYLADETERERIRQRLNWDTTLSGLTSNN